MMPTGKQREVKNMEQVTDFMRLQVGKKMEVRVKHL